MTRKLYCARMFKTLKEAQVFQHCHGGSMSSNILGSRTKQDWMTARCIADMTTETAKDYPYAIQWNEEIK